MKATITSITVMILAGAWQLFTETTIAPAWWITLGGVTFICAATDIALAITRRKATR